MIEKLNHMDPDLSMESSTGRISGNLDYKRLFERVERRDPYHKFIWTFGIILIFGLLYLTSFYSYLLFHCLAEILSIILAWSIFLAAWNSRHFMQNNYLLFMGMAYLFIGSIDSIHMLAYKGMGVFPGHGADLPTQLWIGARYMEGLSFLIALIYIDRKVQTDLVFFGFFIVATTLIMSIFCWDIFPDCYIEGTGLTLFKKSSEYIICLILLFSGIVLFKRRKEFEKSILKTLLASIAVTILSELSFSQYTDVYGFYNLLGHLFKNISFYLIYKGVIQAGLINPYSQLFMDLKRNRDDFEMQARNLEEQVKKLHCLYGISNLREGHEYSLAQTLQEVVELIPPAWQYPDITCARITLEDEEYKTKRFKETHWKQMSRIYSNYKEVGIIEVFYTEARPDMLEGPFLKDERTLINAIAERLGNIVQHERSKEALTHELAINSALSDLYKPLSSPKSSIEDISDSILEKALRITGSVNGFVSSIDPVTGDNVAHTLTEMLKGECRVSGEKRKITFQKGKNGQYPGLWGHSLNIHEAFITNSPEKHASSIGLPPGHIAIKRFLSFPVMLGKELVGQIALANKEEDYIERDLLDIGRLGEYFALAIQRKRIENYLKQARDELEKRVIERTAQLLESNRELKKKIEENRLAMESLKRSEIERRRLSSKLFEAYEEENKRIGQELHDGLAQTLSAIRIWGENALMQMKMGDSEDTLSKTLNSVIRLAQDAIEEVRRIVRNMRPSILDDLGIVTTISWLSKEFETIYSDITVNREIIIEDREVPESLKIVIFRILQEALNNIAKHSKATSVYLTLEKREGKISLRIEDNGTGFDVAEVLSENQTGKGVGIENMRRRSELSGGTFSIESERGKGSVIRVSWSLFDLEELSA